LPDHQAAVLRDPANRFWANTQFLTGDFPILIDSFHFVGPVMADLWRMIYSEEHKSGASCANG
jgi:hypothetical protein